MSLKYWYEDHKGNFTWPWILVKIKLENPKKWQNSAENGPENV